MRFEPEQVLAHVHHLEQVRSAGTAGEARAADYVVEQLRRVGLHVERQELTASLFGSHVATRVAWLLAALSMSVQTEILDRGAPGWLAAVAGLLALLAWWYAGWRPVAAGKRWGPRVRSENIVADRLVEPGPDARVVFLAQLDTFPQRWPRWLRLALEGLMLLLIVLIGDGNLRITGWVGGAAVVPLGIGLWIVALVLAAEPIDRSRSQYGGDSRLGLALWLELARTMPRRTFERVEIRFVALGAQAVDQAGTRRLVAHVSGAWARKPTLAVALFAPGYRTSLGLSGYGPDLALGAAALRDLWIPGRALRALDVTPEQRGRLFRSAGVSYLALVGDPQPRFSMRSAGGANTNVDELPGSIPSVIQLATELALRWAKRCEHAPQPPPESAARSSQKPG